MLLLFDDLVSSLSSDYLAELLSSDDFAESLFAFNLSKSLIICCKLIGDNNESF